MVEAVTTLLCKNCCDSNSFCCHWMIQDSTKRICDWLLSLASTSHRSLRRHSDIGGPELDAAPVSDLEAPVGSRMLCRLHLFESNQGRNHQRSPAQLADPCAHFSANEIQHGLIWHRVVSACYNLTVSQQNKANRCATKDAAEASPSPLAGWEKI